MQKLRKDKKGFLRIMEVMIAITFLTISILYIYTNKAPTQTSLDEFVYNYHEEILTDIAINLTLRTMVLDENESLLTEQIFVPENLNFSLRICDLTSTASPCNMDSNLRTYLFNNGVYEIFSEETIVSSNVSHYDPKKVRLFIWVNPV